MNRPYSAFSPTSTTIPGPAARIAVPTGTAMSRPGCASLYALGLVTPRVMNRRSSSGHSRMIGGRAPAAVAEAAESLVDVAAEEDAADRPAGFGAGSSASGTVRIVVDAAAAGTVTAGATPSISDTCP